MKLYNEINPLFEAMVYLSLRANGTSISGFIEKKTKGVFGLTEENKGIFEPYYELEQELEAKLHLNERLLAKYFKCRNFSAFSFTTYGNLAAAVLGKLASENFIADIDDAKRMLLDQTDEERKSGIITSVAPYYMHSDGKCDIVSTLQEQGLPDTQISQLMDCYYNFFEYFDRIAPMISETMAFLSDFCTLDNGFDFSQDYSEQIESILTDLFDNVDEPNALIEKEYVVYPSAILLTRWFANLKYESKDGRTHIQPMAHVGTLRFAMSNYRPMKDEAKQITMALKALCDPSRFEIMRCLMERPMFGKELAQRLELAPSTTSQHIFKLASAKLIDWYAESSCTYYTVNEKKMLELIDGLKNNFVRKRS